MNFYGQVDSGFPFFIWIKGNILNKHFIGVFYRSTLIILGRFPNNQKKRSIK